MTDLYWTFSVFLFTVWVSFGAGMLAEHLVNRKRGENNGS